mmetsp:Transcript_27723/g.75005  ORF Transcript_27723/g.75005 Transcript_27723/m.75005 type:complete len:722 (+) Transcript_27723:174-2339(+)|eukprot:CAMPEP_0202419578 /NCGR_PEP_ID=MMETSP1128-20130828/49372_1 /ASSEMBLY_ACC=CAM_ASM_000463 /TAXON_ID=3047 /ORGANISM="Dunaliella tertiolecta, Strain CCMP1320" /LENGTH=721 /DNA_ID=CAMNT_0049027527 /DNA_START=1046 /DNA_END=3211 /DNA_ORIENTATION=+
MEPQQAGDKPEEVETKAGDISPQQQDEGTSTAAAPANSEDAGYIGSYTADASAGEGSHEQQQAKAPSEGTPPADHEAPSTSEQQDSYTTDDRTEGKAGSRQSSAKGEHKRSSAEVEQSETEGTGEAPQPERPSHSAGSARSSQQQQGQEPAAVDGQASPAPAEPSQGQQQTPSRGSSAKPAASGEQQQQEQEQRTPSRGGSAKGAPPDAQQQQKQQPSSRGSSAKGALPDAQQQQQQQQPSSRGGSAKGASPAAQQQQQQQQQPSSRGGSANSGTAAQLQHRPMSREGGGAAYAAQAEAAARSKVQAAEASGYIAPGLRLIDVEVAQGPGLPNRLLRVLMDYTQADPKPYLGGNRNKLSGTVFHHAVTQTPKAPRYLGVEPKLERTTQTVRVKHHTAQTNREAATQMERPGLVLDTSNDVERVPGRYQTSEEWMEIVDRSVRLIQRWTRGWFGRKRAAYLHNTKMQREAFLREEEAKAQAAADKHRQTEIERRMHPRTAADFEILYNELEAWRLQETYKIVNASLPKEKEQLMLQQLLHKETKLLQTIDRLKINANHENKDVRIQRTLGEMSKPKTYELRNGTKVEVHTPFTTRAKELMQLYNGLNLPMLTVDERLDVLLHVKWTVKEFDCNLTREIVELVDREADLLNRGRSPKMLEGLRKRISSLFLSFIETPEFNPVSAQYQVVPMDFEQYMFEKLEKSTAKASSTSKSNFATITRVD